MAKNAQKVIKEKKNIDIVTSLLYTCCNKSVMGGSQMEKEFQKAMRIAKKRGDQVIYPVSLTHCRDITYGRTYGEKIIDECEIYIHVEGESTIYVGDQVIHPEYGTVVTYRRGEVHTNYVTGLRPHERYVLLFHFEELVNLWDGMDQTLQMFTQREMFEKNVVRLPPHEIQRLLSLLEKAVNYADSREPERETLFYATFLKILALINNGFLHMVEQREKGSYSPIVNMALEIVEDQFVELQSVEQLARQLRISNSYLARIFKKQVGTSVYEYIQNMKLAYAVKLLAAGKTVTDACFDSGFNNYSYFIQLFKHKYGITPRRYQKSLAESLEV